MRSILKALDVHLQLRLKTGPKSLFALGTVLNFYNNENLFFFLAEFNCMDDFLQVKSSHESAAERLKKRISRLEEVRNQLIIFRFFAL
jgi:hypothetical protein